MIGEGFCQCGCGQRTKVVPFDSPKDGYKKGDYRRFVKGHDSRTVRRADDAPRSRRQNIAFVRTTTGQIETSCDFCGRTLFLMPWYFNQVKHHFCNRACHTEWRKTLTGDRAPSWKGGLSWRGGRAIVFRPDHPRAGSDGYVYRSWIVAEEMIGRPLLPGEEVHHRDENKANDDPSNLVVTPDKDTHLRMFHSLNGRWSRAYEACVDCGTTERRHVGNGLCGECRNSRRRIAA